MDGTGSEVTCGVIDSKGDKLITADADITGEGDDSPVIDAIEL
jgi:hypothetical protein